MHKNISWDDFMQSTTISRSVDVRRSVFLLVPNFYDYFPFDFQFCHLFSIFLLV